MTKKLKIAVYSGAIPAPSFIENLIKTLGQKYSVYIFGKELQTIEYTNGNILKFPIYSNFIKNILVTFLRTVYLGFVAPKRFGILFHEVKKFRKATQKLKWWGRYVVVLLHLPDIFHIQWAKDLENWFFLKERLGVKIVLSLRGAHINYSPLADKNLADSYKKLFPRVDGFHAVSEAISLEAQKYGASAQKIIVIPSIISQLAFNKFSLPQTRSEKSLKIISIGRHHWKKGYNLALDACKLLKDKKIKFHYTIIADGKVSEELLYLRNQLDLNSEVTLQNSLVQEDLFNEIKLHDVLLLPSFEEGIANVVLEAMALGLPVISTDCGGMNEVVIQDKTGWLFPILDQEAIADALINVYESPLNLRQEIVLNAHEFMKEHFDKDKSFQQFNDLYVKVFKNEGDND